MSEQVLLQNRRPDRPATLEEYRASGGYEALAKVLGKAKPRDLTKMVLDSGLKGRGARASPRAASGAFCGRTLRIRAM